MIGMRAIRHHYSLLFRVNVPKLFCSFSVVLKSALYRTSKFGLTLYFCKPLVIIAQENRSMRNIKQLHVFNIW